MKLVLFNRKSWILGFGRGDRAWMGEGTGALRVGYLVGELSKSNFMLTGERS